MKNIFPLCGLAFILLIINGCNDSRPGNPRALVFSKTTGFRHSSIEAGKTALLKLGQENGFDVDTTENAEYFTEDSLKNYSVVIFLNTTDNTDQLLNHYQENAFERYIQAGGGFVGIHAATDAEYQWGWYSRLVGANFESHPEIQEAVLQVVDNNHPSTKHLPDQWKRTDEWYNFKNLNKDVKVLITIDEKSYKGGRNGEGHPIAWRHEYDGGRAFYTELGHTEASYTEENFLKHLLGGIQYAIGGNKRLNYAKAHTPPAPEEDRFTRTVLKQGVFFEPTEMSILPNLDILIAQRRGEILLYKNQDSTIKQVALLPVYYKTSVPNVNAEEGVMGIKIDPDFEKNRFVYIFYSPADTSVNRLSRFTFENDTLLPSSEKIVLEFYSQRQICCHTGGSIAFAKDRIMYLSTGDNSTPFDEPGEKFVSSGFGPMDDRPGHEQYDARRTSANTNDLRGKILRIRVKEDGSYEIPEGNLFKPGQEKTRPEIYVMGNRNPYRISTDQQTGFLYWGEVGPDATEDSLDTRGPRGYDELNQARKPGFFGWPLFVGNNYPYKQFNYATGEKGMAFDAAKPINNSHNNTGLTELPPVSPAFIYYPYAPSKEFPQVGSGGRNAMAGPVYYKDQYPAQTRLPDYYEGKLLIYDWIRGWIKAVTMRPNGDFDKMEPVMPNTRFNAPIDMEMGPDGRLYILEYGKGWFSQNPDAGLVRIDYNGGNRAPKVANISVDRTSGTLPLTVRLKVEANDPEKKVLSYLWRLGNGITQKTAVPELTHTFEKPGSYAISVLVSDPENAATPSDVIDVYAGNEAPEVQVEIIGNKSFYFPGTPVSYRAQATDKDDPAPIDPAQIFVSAQYIQGTDMAAGTVGHQQISEAAMGKNLMLSSDCKACHQIDQKSIGPSYTDVAKKYEKNNMAIAYLAEKIIKGGGGVWGETSMPAHPDLTETDARRIAFWIQSLNAPEEAKRSLPASGSLHATLGQPEKNNGRLFISASYTDKGKEGIQPLTGGATAVLRNSLMNFRPVKNIKGFTEFNRNGTRYLAAPRSTGWFSIDSIDLNAVKSAELQASWTDTLRYGYRFELRLDSPEGRKIGEAMAPPSNAHKPATVVLPVKLETVDDGLFHDLYIIGRANDDGETGTLALGSIRFKTK
ncbi:MAG TPA: ThuA domain-containing protein [Flavitalea sp.]|nr:ThuA domain-containing protein [Flavitalea sp.]